MFIYHFLISNILISLAILAVLIIKAAAGRRLSAKYGLYIWLFIAVLMAVAFVPEIEISALKDYSLTENLGKYSYDTVNITGDSEDLYISVYSYDFLFVIWLLGAAVNVLFMVYGRIRLLRISAEKEINPLFEECCKRVGVRSDLYISPHITSPMSYGILRHRVLLPYGCFDDKSLEHIFLHELIHHKHRDILINYILCVLCAFYWFNPFVHIMLSVVRLDMEIYCDYDVIELAGNNIEYGNTILKMAEKRKGISTVSYFSVSKRNIKARIINIAGFNKKHSVGAVRLTFALMIVLTTALGAVMNSYGYSTNSNVSIPDADYVNLKEYFGDYEGCFVIYDSTKDRYTVYNKSMAEKRVSPDSTYKIALALNGLEEGIITPENSDIEWDGKANPFDEWNRNHNLNSAMKNSVNWYFQSIDDKLDKSEIRDYIEKISYGNMAVYSKKDYWLENSLKISAFEQVEFLRKLCSNKFGFDDDNVNAVLNAMEISDNFYGKTGTGMVNGKIINGWFVGIIDQYDNTYIFAARISADDNATGLTAKKITESILRDLLIIN